ncbi:hypothetical protein L7F22_015163 [Adiantum nelumboides]|nr:hypothetical protein [Adiantum nelumboides]
MPHANALWLHTTKGSSYGGSGASKWTCKYCLEEYSGVLNRLKAHLSHRSGYGIGSCKDVPKLIFDELKGWKSKVIGISLVLLPDWETIHETSLNSSSKRAYNLVGYVDADPISHGGEASNIPVPPKKKTNTDPFRKGHVQAGMQKAAMKIATSEITKLFIQCGLSFNILRSTQWKKTMRAISRIDCEWEGPTYETMRTKGLQKEKENVE